jgi:hypothetical protein
MSNLPAVNSEEHQTFVNENIRAQKQQAAISRCLETSKIKYQSDYSRAQAVEVILKTLADEGVSLKITDRGWPVPEKNGQTGNLQALVDRILLTNQKLGDQASIQAAVQSGELTVECKDDLKTVSQKNEYISRYGLEGWSKLPLHRTVPVDMNKETMKAADYNRLTLQQRIDFQKTLTERQLGAILRRK